ncbi:MAG: hypothetical protein HFJ09_00350 [Lachnospiraceae bacterium]|nr:hypothetical protein [Lachnospiraceae bacterium]
MRKRNQGSVTLETTLVLPIFLFCVITLLYFFQIMLIQEKISQSLWETAKEASRYACIYKGVGGKKQEGNSSQTAKKWVSGALTGIRMSQYLPEDILDNSCIEGGKAGILYKSSILEKDGDISLAALYQVKFPVMTNILPTLKFTQQVKNRGFIGTDKIGLSKKEMEEEDIYVYMTKTGTVYHTSLYCTHINLGIECVSYKNALAMRNRNGGKYKSCHKCTKSANVSDQTNVYISITGDRYHINLECSGLTRDVRKVKLSELNSVGACQRCQG